MKTVRRRFRLITRKDLFELFVCIALAGLFVLLSSGAAFGQGNVGINNPTPHAKSLLDLTSSDKGLLAPRMTAAQRTAMFPAPDATAKGMLVYQTDATQGFYYYDGAAWVMVQTGNAGWGLLGNAGTNPTTNFIGTTDNQGLAFRANNTEHMRIAPNGNVGIGYDSPNFKLDVLGTMPNANMAAIRNLDATGSSTLSMFNHSATAQAYFGMYNPTGIGYAGTATAHPFSINTNNAERMRVTATGNVGIGNTAPVSKLQVSNGSAGYAPNAAALITAESNGAAYMNVISGNSESGVLFGASSSAADGGILYNTTGNPNGLNLRTGGNISRLRVSSTGDVTLGENVAWPGYRLGVVGNSPGTPVAIINQNASGFSGTYSVNDGYTGAFVSGIGNGGHAYSNLGVSGTTTAHPYTLLTGNVERVRITPGGNVGIGTSTPARLLEVASANQGVQRISSANAVNGSVLELSNSTAGSNVLGAINFLDGSVLNGQLGYHKADGMTFRTFGIERMRITSDGNVGIGTTAPAALLHVAANAAGAMPMTVQNTNAAGWSGSNFTSNTGAGNAAVGFDNATSNGFLGTTTNHPVTFISNWQERMRLTADGNLGLGTNAPAAKFDVVDGGSGIVARFQGTTANGYSVAHWIRSDNVGAHVGFFNPGVGGPLAGNFVAGTFGNAPVSLTTNNTERIRIATDGKVGIGTTAPASELEVNGFTKLGSDAPAIKTKKLTGTTPASQGAFVDVPHGVTGSKILSVQVLIEYSAGNWIPQSYTHSAGYSANFLINATNIRVYTETGNSGNILSRPMKLLITYEA